MSVRVLIADDHPLIVEGLSTALARLGIEVVGDVGNAEDVASAFTRSKPDVLLLDVRFGGALTGLDVAREMLEKKPKTKIVFYSQFDQDEIVQEAYRIGALGFVTKNTSPAELAAAIKQAMEGQPHFLPKIAERLALIGLRGDESPQRKLDARELEVFTLMAHGRTNVEIAEAMSLSPKTISMTSQSIKDKLGVERPAEITRLAVRYKIIEA